MTAPRSDAVGGDFSLRATYPNTVGVYLAVNAISDAVLLVDSPRCAYTRLPFVQGNHDWSSTLDLAPGPPRIINTALTTDTIIGARDAAIAEALTGLAQREGVGLVLLSSMPMSLVTAVDYRRIAREVQEATGVPVVHVPYGSISSDWLDGYAEVSRAMAGQIDVDGGARSDESSRSVAIVGYLFDRNEGDHEANIAELQRLIDGLRLELVSTWLGGGTVSDLCAVGDAEVIVSLPYARRAGRALAKRTQARLVEAELPFGLEGTQRFLRAIADAFSCRERAEELIDRELSKVIPKLEWVSQFVFQHRRMGYIGDPHLLWGFRDIATLLGCVPTFEAVTNLPKHLLRDERGEQWARETKSKEQRLLFPTRERLEASCRELIDQGSLDCVVTNSSGALLEDVAVVELGFPSYFTHALYERPFMGFGGFLATVDTMANSIRRHEARRARRVRRDVVIDEGLR